MTTTVYQWAAKDRAAPEIERAWHEACQDFRDVADRELLPFVAFKLGWLAHEEHETTLQDLVEEMQAYLYMPSDDLLGRIDQVLS